MWEAARKGSNSLCCTGPETGCVLQQTRLPRPLSQVFTLSCPPPAQATAHCKSAQQNGQVSKVEWCTLPPTSVQCSLLKPRSDLCLYVQIQGRALRSTVLWCNVLYCGALISSTIQYIAPLCTVLHWSVLNYTVLCYTALWCIGQFYTNCIALHCKDAVQPQLFQAAI